MMEDYIMLSAEEEAWQELADEEILINNEG